MNKKSFVLGFLTATGIFLFTGLSYAIVKNSLTEVAGVDDTKNSPPPQIHSVINSPDGLVIRGLKFGSKGKVCVGEETCTELKLVSWGSSSIRAEFESPLSGPPKVWIITGDNLVSNKFSF